ncbi:MAG: AAA family ATPase [Metallosphaera sp.]
MRIESVSLKDFLSHDRTQVNFKGEINVIIGQNGAGKSSIIDAITFALFKEARENVSELIRKGSKSAEVELILKEGSNSFKVVRSIPASDYFYENDKLSARQSREVDKKVESIGLNKKVMLSTTFVKQGEIESVFEDLTGVLKKVMMIDSLEKLTSSDGKIKRLIDAYEVEMKSYQRYEDELKRVSSDILSTSSDIATLEASVSSLQDELHRLHELEDIKSKEVVTLEEKFKVYTEVRTQLETNRRERTQILNELDSYKDLDSQLAESQTRLKELQELTKKKDLISKLESETKRYQELNIVLRDEMKRRDSIKANLDLKEKLEPYHKEYQELYQKQRDLREAYEKFRELRAALCERRRQRDLNLKKLAAVKLVRKAEDLERELSLMSAERDEAHNEISRLELELVQIRKGREALISANEGKCPVCGGPLDEAHRKELIDKYDRREREIVGEMESLQRKYESLKREVEILNKQLSEARSNESLIKTIQENLEGLNQEIAQLEASLSELTEKANQYELINERLEHLKEYEDEYNSVRSYKEEDLYELEEMLATHEHTLHDVKEEINNLKREVGNLTRDQIERAELELQEVTNRLNELNKKRGKREELVKRRYVLEESIERLKQKLDALNFEEEELRKAKVELDSIRRQVQTVERDLGEKRGKLEQMRISLSNLERTKRDLETKLSEANKLRNEKERLEKLRQVLSESRLQSFLISTLISRIENNLNDIMSMFNMSFSRVTIRMGSTKGLKGKVEIKVYTQSGQELQIGLLSGGERIALALALRIAIARSLMGELGFMILDEPTTHLDSERRTELLSIIRDSMNVVPQIIVVTHDEEVLQIADYVLRVEKLGDVSRVKEEVIQ